MDESNHELGPVSEAVVAQSQRITSTQYAEVRRIRLRVDDPAFRYAAGQSIGVLVPGPQPFGNRHHMRRYSIASGRRDFAAEAVEFDLLVRRCFYLDEVSGEQYPGIASNYLCDAQAGESLTITGPYRSPFRMPPDDRANLLMIGTGTGVAPFRSFLQEIYRDNGGWRGQVRLYYGAQNGLDLLYRNDEQHDLDSYYDQPSFQAFRAMLGRPLASEADCLEEAISVHLADVWALIQQPDTYVFLAGLDRIAERLDALLETVAGSAAAWRQVRERLHNDGRWSELIYS